MKRVRINMGKVGLVFKNGNYKRVLTEGAYWLSPFEEVFIYDLAKPFHSSMDLNILLKDPELAELLIVVEVADNEIALQYENGLFKNVVMPGRYAFWKGVVNYTFKKADLSKVEITEDIEVNVLTKREVLQFVRIYRIDTNEKGLLFIDGGFSKMLGTGVYYFWSNPIVVTVLKTDLRQLQFEVLGQEILTKDKAALRVNFTVQYKVSDIQKALLENKDYEKQLYVIAQLALREYIGALSLDELLEKKTDVTSSILEVIKLKAAGMGIDILDCGIKDVILPGEMKDIMNQVLVAQKKAEANTIMRREETASTRSLLNTAKLMDDNPMLWKLKEMEYIEKIAERIDSLSLSGNNLLTDQLKNIFTK